MLVSVNSVEVPFYDPNVTENPWFDQKGMCVSQRMREYTKSHDQTSGVPFEKFISPRSLTCDF